MKSQFHEEFYSFAKYYDIAFDFKDIPAECHFLKTVFQEQTGKQPSSFIEFGSGPALHCLEMAKELKSVTAVDLSKEMTAYADTKARLAGLTVKCECADMIRYHSDQKYDLAALLMDSTSYLLTNEDVITHLKAVSQALNPDGIYILEMSHPKGVFGAANVTETSWEMEKDDVKVKIQWGKGTDSFDPIAQITNVSVRLDYEDGDKVGFNEDVAPQRCFTATEFEALVRASGVFEIVARYGAMDASIGFDNSEKSWRMVLVLRRLCDGGL